MFQLNAISEIKQGLSTSGRAAGGRPGDWTLRVIESANIVQDRLQLDGLREIKVVRGTRTEKHLLRPFDLLSYGAFPSSQGRDSSTCRDSDSSVLDFASPAHP